MKGYSVNKHGNTAVITLPAFARESLGIEIKDKVSMKIIDNKLVVEKLEVKEED